MGRKSDNRGKIPEIAARLFWTRSYEAVGVDDICLEAGIHKGTLYHFFKNKEEIALAAIQANARMVDNFLETVKSKSGDERILAYFDFMSGLQRAEYKLSRKVAGCPFGNIGVEIGTTNDPLRHAVLDWFERMIEFLAVALSEQHRINKKKARALASELLTYWEGALVLAKATNSLKPLQEAREFSVRMVGPHRPHTPSQK